MFFTALRTRLFYFEIAQRKLYSKEQKCLDKILPGQTQTVAITTPKSHALQVSTLFYPAASNTLSSFWEQT